MAKILKDKNKHQITLSDGRFYENPSNPNSFIASVTHVMGNGLPTPKELQEWQKLLGKNADVYMQQRADVGSCVHDLIENFTLGQEVIWEEGWNGRQITFEEWQMLHKGVEFWKPLLSKNGPAEIILTETTIFDEDEYIAGTLDCAFKLGGEAVILDYKTSNNLHDSYYAQICAYGRAYNKLKGYPKATKGMILWVNAKCRTNQFQVINGVKIQTQGKGWKLEVFNLDDVEHNRLWDMARDNYKYLNPNAKPFTKTLPTKVSL